MALSGLVTVLPPAVTVRATDSAPRRRRTTSLTQKQAVTSVGSVCP